MQGVLFLTQRHLRHLAVPLQRQQRVAVPVGRVVAVELAPDADVDELNLDAICNQLAVRMRIMRIIGPRISHS